MTEIRRISGDAELAAALLAEAERGARSAGEPFDEEGIEHLATERALA